MRVLDLFSGLGAFSLGLQRAGMTTVAFCEIDPWPSAVLKKHWPSVANLGDIRSAVFPDADLICAGFPCQDISNAGKRAGIAGPRSGLWREVVRAIRLVRPRYALLENVAALLGRGMGTVLGDLAAIGHDAEWDRIPAQAVGAPHRRSRIWIAAYPERDEQSRAQSCHGSIGRVGWQLEPLAWDRDWQVALREFRGMDDGSAYGVERVDTLRNSLVPQIPQLIGQSILQADTALQASGN